MRVDDVQRAASTWVEKVFGSEIAVDAKERGLRMVEEAIECAQVVEVPRHIMHMLVDIVYDKPVGDAVTEVGQLLFVLGSFAEATGVNMEIAVSHCIAYANTPERIEKVLANQKHKKEIGL